jgi:hypothetical protein
MGGLMRSIFAGLPLFFCISFSTAQARESIRVESLKQGPPGAVAAEIRETLGTQGFRLMDSHGRPFADIWLRKGIPAGSKPEGPKGGIQFPCLADGELVGVLQFAAEGHDYREQTIAKGVYTMRYGLQPANGDHLGVSAYRDYVLLLPSTKDKVLAAPQRRTLVETSAESAGTVHPAAFLLLAAPADAAKSGSAVIHDEEKNTWGVVLPLNLRVKESGEAAGLSVLLIVVGVATV